MTTSLKERRWEIMEVDERFGPTMVTVDTALIRSHAFSVDNFDLAHLVAGDHGRLMGLPTLLCREARDVIGTVYDIASGGAGMHAKHQCWFFGCPEAGETYEITGRHSEKYIKREKQYIVLDSEVLDASGRTVLRQRSTHIRALKPGVAKSAAKVERNETAPEPQIAADRAQIAPGRALKPLSKLFTQDHLNVFAGTDWNNIHNDPTIAQAAGLRAPVASGLQTMAAVSELMESYFGRGWTDGGTLAVAFTAPLFVGEPFTVNALVEDFGPSRVTAQVRCDTSAGVRVLAGTASARLT